MGLLLCYGPAGGAVSEAPQAASGFDLFGVHLGRDLSLAALVAPVVGLIGYGGWIYQKIKVADATFLVISATLTRLEKKLDDESAARRNDNKTLSSEMKKQGEDLTARMDRKGDELRADLGGQISVLREDIRALDEKFDRKFDRLGQDVAFLRGVRTERQRQTQASVDL